jgi:hypothetical protein
LTVTNIQNAHNPELFHSCSVLRPLTNKEQMQRANALCKSTSTGLTCSGKIFVGMLMMLMFTLTACSEKMMPAGITGYNHMNGRLSIYDFTVNGAMGANVRQGGGGGESCCVMIPEKWRPGLKVTVAWSYDTNQKDQLPPPPDQQKEVEIPEYKHGGKIWVHFYDNHQVKIVVSNCSIEHPFYPMRAKDKLPWIDGTTKDEEIKYEMELKKKGVVLLECN